MTSPPSLDRLKVNPRSDATRTHPALTTVRAPAHEMGAQTMRMLQKLIAGRQPDLRRVVLPTALVVRQSRGAHG
jgi:DNA-binding LacI/PurR family transcriptional regulator